MGNVLICIIQIQVTYTPSELSVSGCSKLMTSLVNISLKFQTLISEIYQYFLLKKI